jgi:hypothetical protein
MQRDEVALHAAVGQLALLREAALPALEELRREALDGPVPELGLEDADDAPVAGEGARLHGALMLAVAQPLGGGVRERRARADYAGQLAASGLGQRGIEPRLRGRLREAGVEANP